MAGSGTGSVGEIEVIEDDLRDHRREFKLHRNVEGQLGWKDKFGSIL